MCTSEGFFIIIFEFLTSENPLHTQFEGSETKLCVFEKSSRKPSQVHRENFSFAQLMLLMPKNSQISRSKFEKSSCRPIWWRPYQFVIPDTCSPFFGEIFVFFYKRPYSLGGTSEKQFKKIVCRMKKPIWPKFQLSMCYI